MNRELSEFNNLFIKLNVFLSIIGALLSILPTFLIYILIQFMVHGYKMPSSNPHAYFLLLIPAAFYSLWIYILGTSRNINDSKAYLKKLPWLIINTIITSSLLIFYLTIFLKLKFGL